MGSVKDLQILETPDEYKSGRGRFYFSDRYSVFDWGEMPDHIQEKGTSLCLMGAYYFEKLQESGIETHYLGLVEDGKVKKLQDLRKPVNVMEVKLFRIIKPERKDGGYDYSVYKTISRNFLIPLEVIYRNALPPGSSVFKRLQRGELSIEELGLTEPPRPGQILKQPILDVSTKLEATDRYIRWDEAAEISGLGNEKVEKMKEITLSLNRIITEKVKPLGLYNEDGKFEFALNEKGELCLVDVLGTPDECRFTFQGMPVSKEIARIYYRRSVWYQKVEEAKKEYGPDWRRKIGDQPEPLPEELSRLISELYKSICNQITGREWWKVPALEAILAGIKLFTD